jgi:phage shock protein A
MTEKVDLEISVDSAIRETRENYEAAMVAVARLKEEMNRLERRITEDGMGENAGEVAALSALTSRFNELTDSQILESKRAWRKYEELKREGDAQATEVPRLNEFYDACTKTRQLAADLTCYSLGNPKR